MLTFIIKFLTPDEVDHIKETFENMDKDHNGVITYENL